MFKLLELEHLFNHPTLTVFIGIGNVAFSPDKSSGIVLPTKEAVQCINRYTGSLFFNDAILSIRSLFSEYTEKDINDLDFLLSLHPDKIKYPPTPDDMPFCPHIELLVQSTGMWYAIAQIAQLKSSELYSEVFKPSLNIRLKYLYSKPPLDSDKMNRNQQIVDDLCGWLDLQDPVIFLNQQLQYESHGQFAEVFSPLSNNLVSRLMKQLDYKPYYDLSELLWVDDQHHLVQTILDVQSLSNRREYAVPVIYESVAQWEPNKQELANQAFSLGYIKGPLGQRFHTPLAKKCVQSAPTQGAIYEAKRALEQASLSKLLLYKHLVDNGSEPLSITSLEVTYEK